MQSDERKPVSFRDVEDLRLGAEARTRDSAEQMIEQHADQEEAQLETYEQDLVEGEQRNIREDAMRAIEHLQQVEDPEAELSKLPPALQEEIKAIIDGSEVENQEELQLNDGEQIQEVQNEPMQEPMQETPISLIKPIDDNIQDENANLQPMMLPQQ